VTETHQDPPWEPPLAGPADAQILAALDRLRWTFRWKVDGLDAVGLAATVGRSSLTLGALVKHLAAGEDHALHAKIRGVPMPQEWQHDAWEQDPDWDLHSAANDSPEHLYTLWDAAVARSRAHLAEVVASPEGLDTRAAISDTAGELVSVRRVVCDLVEEYGRHTGHADLLRESVDGLTGEDPPGAWRPIAPAARAAGATGGA
jgi:hypothetical protein